jgi:hypothetical protein
MRDRTLSTWPRQLAGWLRKLLLRQRWLDPRPLDVRVRESGEW